MCFHSYVHQPRDDVAPGFTHSRYGTHFGRHNTWWPQAGGFVEYLARCQYLLQKGRDVRDVLLLRHDDLEHNDFADYPNVPAGHKWDLLAVKQLLTATVENRRIRLAAGGTYAALALPNRWSASVAVLKELDELVQAGAVVVGPAPVATVGLMDLRNNLAEWNGLVKKLWNDASERKVQEASLEEVLAQNGLKPDFEFESENPSAKIEFIHRMDENFDAYFLTNQTGKPVMVGGRFRIGHRQPELWDAVTRKITKAKSFAVEDGRMLIPLSLDAGGSIFVVFRGAPNGKDATWITYDAGNHLPNDATVATDDQALIAATPGEYVVTYVDGGEHRTTVEAIPTPVEATGPWQVAFQAGRGAPASITLERLASLSTHADSGVKYFSGTATYSTTLAIPQDKLGPDVRAYLDLGAVRDLAEVAINGKPVGVVWTAPFRVDVTEHLKPGENAVTVAVTNTWVNRMIGDEQIEPDVKYATDGSKFTIGRLAEFPSWFNDPAAVKARKRISFPMWRHYEKDSPLLESGLIGPVTLRFARVVAVGP